MRAACASAVRRHCASSVALLALFLTAIISHAQTDPLASWNEGPAKQRIVDFVRTTTDKASPHFVPPEARIATFDQDGTLWVEHPIYTQVAYCLDRVPAVVAKKPELKNVEPFKTVLSGDHAAIAKLSLPELEKILAATLTGMSVEDFTADARGGSQLRNTRVGTARTPTSCISRCWRFCNTCAQMATRRTS